jgi:rhodanese-related sulfurtransferase
MSFLPMDARTRESSSLRAEEDDMPNAPSRAADPVTEIPAAESREAAQHFERLLAYETDCWDVNAAVTAGHPAFVLLDVRSPAAFAAGHLPGAVNLPVRLISEQKVAGYAPATLIVVYCNGPHCNGADRAALALARLGRPVKKMIGGVTGWRDEGFALTTD